MAVTTELERFAKLADFAESVLGLVREFGFLKPPRALGRRPTKATATSEGNGEIAEGGKRRGRPKGSKNKPKDAIPPPPADTEDVGMDADALEEDE